MALLRFLLPLAVLCSVQVVGAHFGDGVEDEQTLYGGFSSSGYDDICPDYTSYASYPQ
jgi:hypothetical protein